MRAVLTILLLVGCVHNVVSQDSNQARAVSLNARMGACIGAPIPVGDIPAGSSGSPRPGFVAGLTIDVPLSQQWSVSIEPQFVHYDATFITPLVDQPYIDKIAVTTPDGSTTILEVSTTFTGEATGEFSTDYIQVPVLARLQTSTNWSVLAGGYLGWMVQTKSNATGVGTVGIRPEVVTRNLEFGDRMQGFDVGLQLGGQVQIYEDLQVALRGVYGLTSIFSPDFATVDRTVQNIFLHLTVGFRLM
ncbi:MAG: porin family protein [Candidatus Kapabacteria bacterium]|nr:porin family protein [Candidatus Kapabacteria bacterium]